jgi:hypothetical protein
MLTWLERDARVVLCCMSMLERAVAEAYARALRGEADPAIRAALTFISADSEKHARVLEALASGAACRRDECQGLMGTAWGREMEAAERVADLRGLLAGYDDLLSLESAAGEEYSAQIFLKAVESMGSIPSALAHDLLRMISEDEERHGRLLSAIRNRIAASGQGGRQRRRSSAGS